MGVDSLAHKTLQYVPKRRFFQKNFGKMPRFAKRRSGQISLTQIRRPAHFSKIRMPPKLPTESEAAFDTVDARLFAGVDAGPQNAKSANSRGAARDRLEDAAANSGGSPRAGGSAKKGERERSVEWAFTKATLVPRRNCNLRARSERRSGRNLAECAWRLCAFA